MRALPLVSVLLLAAAVASADGAEVRYQGKTAREWAVLLRSPDSETRDTASQALADLGPDAAPAVPLLLEAANDENAEIQRDALLVFQDIGPAARDGVPGLIALLRTDPPKRDRERGSARRLGSIWALGAIGPAAKEAVPLLVELLRARARPTEGSSAAEALGNIGPDAVGATPVLITALDDADPGLRRAAAVALGRIGPGAKAALDSLQARGKDPDGRVRVAVAVASYRLSEVAKSALPALVEGIGSPKEDVRSDAFGALGDMRGAAAGAVPALIEALKSQDSKVRWQAANTLSELGAAAKPALSTLIAALGDPATDFPVATALRAFGPDAAAATPVLERLAGGGETSLRICAIRALHAIAGRGKEHLPYLVAALKDPKGVVQWMAADALGDLGVDARPALPVLEALIERDDVWPRVRRAAKAAVLRIRGT